MELIIGMLIGMAIMFQQYWFEKQRRKGIQEDNKRILEDLEFWRKLANQEIVDKLQFAEYCSLSDYICCSDKKIWFDENDKRPNKTTKELYDLFIGNRMIASEKVFERVCCDYKDELKTLLQKFWGRKSDACPLECTEHEKQLGEWEEWIKGL